MQQSLVVQIADVHTLDAALVCAVIEQESGGNPLAIRFERSWALKLMADPSIVGKHSGPCSLQTEIMQRATSWGLMQVLGQTAREHGCTADFLTALTADSEAAIEIGCTVLAHKLKLAGGDVAKALLFWNGGGNPNYPAEVQARMPKYRKSP